MIGCGVAYVLQDEVEGGGGVRFEARLEWAVWSGEWDVRDKELEFGFFGYLSQAVALLLLEDFQRCGLLFSEGFE